MISAYACMHGLFDHNATPLGPLGCIVIIHKKNAQRHTWDFRGREGWSIGAAMDSYRCDRVIPRDTMYVCVSDTVEYRHHHLTLPTVTPADRILHGLHSLTSALHNVPPTRSDAQIKAISDLRDICQQWQTTTNPAQKPASNPGQKPNDTNIPAPANINQAFFTNTRPGTTTPAFSTNPGT